MTKHINEPYLLYKLLKSEFVSIQELNSGTTANNTGNQKSKVAATTQKQNKIQLLRKFIIGED
ncbi:MAG TPA: hypothetical protein VFV86_10570 [Nitrososphaeraceae archaeon]|nr:hypothetical protein [Nitrososphaeraceae archaeon]